MDAQSSFGELRSMLHSSLDTRRKREKLLVFLMEVHDQDREAYTHQWLPYLEHASAGWPDPFGTVTSLEEAEEAAKLLPGARFRLSLSHLGEEELDLVSLRADERLALISGLFLHGLPLNTLDLQQLLGSDHLRDLRQLDLGKTELGSVEPLVTSAKLDNLEMLDLSSTHLDAGYLELKRAQGMKRLRVLDLSGNWLLESESLELRAAFPTLEQFYV